VTDKKHAVLITYHDGGCLVTDPVSEGRAREHREAVLAYPSVRGAVVERHSGFMKRGFRRGCINGRSESDDEFKARIERGDRRTPGLSSYSRK
jgi:hypothetical protein